MDHLMNSNDDVTIKNNTNTIMCPVTPAPVITMSWNHGVMLWLPWDHYLTTYIILFCK